MYNAHALINAHPETPAADDSTDEELGEMSEVDGESNDDGSYVEELFEPMSAKDILNLMISLIC